MGGKKNSAKVYDYLASIHYGICHGPIDSINEMRIHDKRVWCGAVYSRQDVCVNLPEVFGGDGKEGGVKGVVECYTGTSDQYASEELAGRMGLTPSTAPGYRGIASLFFRGMNGDGFKWITNNPYVPSLDVNVTRLFRELNSEYAAVWPLGTDEPDYTSDWSVPLESDGNTYRVALRTPELVPIPGIGPSGPHDDVLGEYRPLGHALGIYCDPDMAKAGFDETFFSRNKIVLDEDGQPLDQNGAVPSEVIDAGLASMTVQFRGKFANVYPRYPGSGVIQFYTWFYAGAIDPISGEMVPGEPINPPGIATAVSGSEPRLSRSFSIPAGARFYRNYVGYRTYPFSTKEDFGFEVDQDGNPLSFISYSGLEYTHCKLDGPPVFADANPANFLWELYINSDWGLGEDPAMMNRDSFQAASQVLHAERFGISFQWTKQSSGEAMAQEVLDHIKAFLFQDPVDARWTLKLLRNDYVRGDLTVIGPSDCTITESKRRLWSEVTNEIVVTYTDAETEEDATVTAHNGAALAIQSGVSSDSRNYYMARNANLAQALADRDVTEVGYPLWSGTLNLSRKFWDVRPGDVFRLNYPDDEIEDMVIRVMSVRPGSVADRKIIVDVTEDIFSVNTTVYRSPQTPLGDNRPKQPAPLTSQTVISAPYPLLIMSGATPDEIEAQSPLNAVVPMGFHDNLPVNDIEVWVKEGATLFNRGAVAPTPCRFSDFTLPEEIESEIPRWIVDHLGRGMIFPGDYLMIGMGNRDSEIVRLDAFNRAGQFWFAQRGMMDTVPRHWDAGFPLWVLPVGSFLEQTYAPQATPQKLRMLPRVDGKRLHLSRAADVSYETGGLAARAFQPTRPANCQVMRQDGLTGFGFEPAIFDSEPYPTDIGVIWANRNRLMDEGTHPAWDDPGVSPEPGQTTTLRVWSADREEVLEEYTGLTGESFSIPASDFGPSGTGYVEFVAVRDGFESHQNAMRYVSVGPIEGWGRSWNFNWNG